MDEQKTNGKQVEQIKELVIDAKAFNYLRKQKALIDKLDTGIQAACQMLIEQHELSGQWKIDWDAGKLTRVETATGATLNAGSKTHAEPATGPTTN